MNATLTGNQAKQKQRTKHLPQLGKMTTAQSVTGTAAMSPSEVGPILNKAIYVDGCVLGETSSRPGRSHRM